MHGCITTRRSTIVLVFALLGCLVVVTGCQQSRGLSREEVMAILAERDGRFDGKARVTMADALALQREAQSRLAELTSRIAKAEDVSGGGASILAADGKTAGQLRRTLAAIQGALDLTASNIANAQTIGYKAVRADFVGPDGKARLVRDFSQGAPLHTGRDLDLAIRGNGFFIVSIETEEGEIAAYARAGNFFINSDGEMVMGNSEGTRLQGGICFPPNTVSVEITANGIIKALLDGNTTPCEIGQVGLARFINPDGLEPIGGNLFLETSESGESIDACPGEDGTGVILQRYLESSNVDPMQEMLTIIRLCRWYEALCPALEAAVSQEHARSR